MKPVLVTGASGFLGWHIARLLVERGHRVRALLRAGSRIDGIDVERVTGDLRDADSLHRAAAGCSLVFHAAADYRLWAKDPGDLRSEEHTSELQSRSDLVCRLLLEKKKTTPAPKTTTNQKTKTTIT